MYLRIRLLLIIMNTQGITIWSKVVEHKVLLVRQNKKKLPFRFYSRTQRRALGFVGGQKYIFLNEMGIF